MIRITRNGLMLEGETADGTFTSHVLARPDDTLFMYLDEIAEVDPDVTVDDVLRAMSDFEEEIDLTFSDDMNGVEFRVFIEELDSPGAAEPHLLVAEIGHRATVRMDGYFAANCGFGAIGLSTGEGLDAYSLQYTPIPAYRHLPLRLNPMFRVYRENPDGTEVLALECKKDFSLHDIFSAIVCEISYYGTPEERARVLEETLDNIDQAVNKGDLDLSAPDIDERILPLIMGGRDAEVEKLRGELRVALSKEDYERASEIRDIIRALGGEQPDPAE